MRKEFQYIPFALRSTEPALIIGIGGGLDVLGGLLSGAKHVTAVELNPGLVQNVNHFSKYDGDLFRRLDVNLVVGDGRNLIESE